MAKYVNTLTQDGFDTLKNELSAFEEKRQAAVDELTWARDLGDRSENAAYKSARRKLSSIDSRIRFLKKTLENSRIVKVTQSEYVDIGCIVVVNNGTKDITFAIVGDHEANPALGKVSFKSPIGHALLGKKVGDRVEVAVPSGTVSYHIISIGV